MFTGIINHLGTITSFEKNDDGALLTMSAPHDLADRIEIGSSLSHNGVCLTIIQKETHGEELLLGSFLMNETLRLTSFENAQIGDSVNLEPSLRLGDELGGHLMFGHIDGVGTITQLHNDGNATIMTVSISKSLLPYLAHKGSVGVEGISLTVVAVGADFFTVSLIPHTLEMTNLHQKKEGDPLNIEIDMLARYVHAHTVLPENQSN